MQSVFTLNANELNDNFLLAIKNLFGDRKIEILVNDTQDENGFTQAEIVELKNRIADVEAGNAKLHDLIEA